MTVKDDANALTCYYYEIVALNQMQTTTTTTTKAILPIYIAR